MASSTSAPLARSAPSTGCEPMPPELSTLTWLADFLSKSGPVALAILTGYWAFKKDREAHDLRDQHEAAMAAAFKQILDLTTAQTLAVAKMESAVDAVKDLLMAARVNRRDE